MAIGALSTQAGISWPLRLGRWSIRLALAALAIAAIGLTIARYDVIPKLAGFSAFLRGGLIGLLGLLLRLAALFAGRKRGAFVPSWRHWPRPERPPRDLPADQRRNCDSADEGAYYHGGTVPQPDVDYVTGIAMK